MDLGRTLTWTAERWPERLAVAGTTGSLTYEQWDARTNQVAHALLDLGVRPGDRVLSFLSNSEEMATTHLALQKIGALSTPLNIRLAPNELAYCLDDARPSVVLAEDRTRTLAADALRMVADAPLLIHIGTDPLDGAHDFDEIVAAAATDPTGIDVGPGDPSVMLYTSGTTGKPKGVPRTQLNEASASTAHVIQCRYATGEVTLGAMPMYHTMGLRSLLSMVIVGGTLVEQAAFNPAEALDLIEREGVSALYLVPTAFWSIAEQDGAMERMARSVRKLAFAGAPMTSSLVERLVQGISPEVFVNHYGSSEIYTFSIADDASLKPGSAGRAGINGRLRVVDPLDEGEHRPVGADVVGEICADISSDEAFSGYWNRPDADAKSIRDGWYHTGDLGHLDAEGDLWVDGRVDDMIISGGENVHPVEVEDVLVRHPDVAEAVVVGLKDEKWGQAVTAFVVPRDESVTPSEFAARLEEWSRTEAPLSAYKRPKKILVISSIPKSPVGKILRRKLVAGEYTLRTDAAGQQHTPQSSN